MQDLTRNAVTSYEQISEVCGICEFASCNTPVSTLCVVVRMLNAALGFFMLTNRETSYSDMNSAVNCVDRTALTKPGLVLVGFRLPKTSGLIGVFSAFFH